MRESLAQVERELRGKCERVRELSEAVGELEMQL